MKPKDSHKIAYAMQEKPLKDLDFLVQLHIRKRCRTGEIQTYGGFEKVMQAQPAQTSAQTLVDKNTKINGIRTYSVSKENGRR